MVWNVRDMIDFTEENGMDRKRILGILPPESVIITRSKFFFQEAAMLETGASRNPWTTCIEHWTSSWIL